MENVDILNIIKKQWANTKDIMALANCKYTKAREIANEIETEILAEGKLIPMHGLIHMERVVKKLNINEQRVIRFAMAEVKIKKVVAANND